MINIIDEIAEQCLEQKINVANIYVEPYWEGKNMSCFTNVHLENTNVHHKMDKMNLCIHGKKYRKLIKYNFLNRVSNHKDFCDYCDFTIDKADFFKVGMDCLVESTNDFYKNKKIIEGILKDVNNKLGIHIKHCNLKARFLNGEENNL